MREKLTKKNQQTGFTIIEVVLVLAIAGLIFLIVFLALPQLQKSRRDTQRKADAGRLLTALENFAGNTNGSYPADAAAVTSGVVGVYIGGNADTWADPSTGSVYVVSAHPTALTQGQMSYITAQNCTGGTNLGARTFAIRVFQEAGGSYCQSNR